MYAYIFNRKQVVHNLKHAAAISLMFKAESFAKQNPGLQLSANSQSIEFILCFFFTVEK